MRNSFTMPCHLCQLLAGTSRASLLLSLIFLGSVPASASGEPLPSPWTLQAAVTLGLKDNPRVAMVRERLEAARALTTRAQSFTVPEVMVQGGYHQTDSAMQSFGNILNQGEFDQTIDFNDPGRSDELYLNTEVHYRLWDGGARESSVLGASSGAEAALQDLHTSRQQLAYEIVSSYHQAQKALELERVRQVAIEAIEASVTVGRARYEAGDLLLEDLLNLELQLARATEEHIRSQHDRQLAVRTFWTLLGRETVAMGDRLPSAAQEQAPPEQLRYDSRPELLALDQRLLVQRAQLAAAESGRLPTIDAFGGYRLGYGPILDGSVESWTAGIRLDYPLYNGNRTEAEIAAAQAELRALQAERQRLQLALGLELQQAELALQQAEARLRVTGKMTEVAKKSAELSRIRFQEGVILASDLIEMEMRLTDALARHTAAGADRRLAIANLLRATGSPQFPDLPPFPGKQP